jgi:hypothetical protein
MWSNNFFIFWQFDFVQWIFLHWNACLKQINCLCAVFKALEWPIVSPLGVFFLIIEIVWIWNVRCACQYELCLTLNQVISHISLYLQKTHPPFKGQCTHTHIYTYIYINKCTWYSTFLFIYCFEWGRGRSQRRRSGRWRSRGKKRNDTFRTSSLTLNFTVARR